MAEEKHSNIKINHLDLAKRKFELDEIFDLVINRIPDLCMPSAFRLAGEDDFFNKTKDIKLVHFRKQRDFDVCTSPNSEQQPKSSNSEIDIPRPTFNEHKIRSRKDLDQIESKHKLELSSRKVKFSFIKQEGPNEGEKSRQQNKRVIRNNEKSRWNSQAANESVRSKLETRDKLIKRYSNINFKTNNRDLEESYRIGYDKLFQRKPDIDYPFANPIAECMLTEDNIDNLREIIVSAVNIEWKMLTPVRPNSDYEENYFDKLINLHRNRYKSRLECGYFKTNQKLPFKHTRHTFVMQYGSRKSARSSSSSADRREQRQNVDLNDLTTSGGGIKLTIPTLTLTSDEKSSEPIVDYSDEEFNDGLQEFDYESFSRFSPNNMRKMIKGRSSSSTSSISPSSSPQKYRDTNEEVVVGRSSLLDGNDLEFANKQEMNFAQSNDDSLEDQVESIISHLMNNNLTGI